MEENKLLPSEILEKEGFKLVKIVGKDGGFFAYRKDGVVVAFEPVSMKSAVINLPEIYYENNENLFIDGKVKPILETAWL